MPSLSRGDHGPDETDPQNQMLHVDVNIGDSRAEEVPQEGFKNWQESEEKEQNGSKAAFYHYRD